VAAGRTNVSPDASFTATPTQASSAPVEVDFVDTSVSTDLDAIESVTWDFGDGATAQGTSVDHTYTANGTYTATLTVCDYLACDQATKQIFVGNTPPPNQPPVANGDFLFMVKDGSADVDVLANDYDPELDPLSVTTFSQGVHGTVSCTSAGVCTFTPAAGFTGFDSFTYHVSDGHSSASAVVTVQVEREPNVPPVATDDDVTTSKDQDAQFSVLANDVDPDGGQISMSLTGSPSHGTIACAFTGVCTFTPDQGFVGSDGFDYLLYDDRGGSDTGHVSITVEDTPPVGNRPPTAVDDVVIGAGGGSIGISPTGNDFDPDADTLLITGTTQPAHGAVDCSSQTFCFYTPETDFIGTDSFTYDISDGQGGTDTATVTIDVQNHLPYAASDELTTGKDLPGTVNVLANDSDSNGHALSVVDNTQGTHGSVDCDPGGTCTYLPESGFVGDDEFQYTVSDGHDGMALATVSVHVREIVVAGPDWVWRVGRELTIEPGITAQQAYTCSWDFGDGDGSTQCDLVHTYTSTGGYDATLTVKVNGGPTVTDDVHVEVIAAGSGGGGGGGIGGDGEVVLGTDVSYTVDADFERATFLNLNHDAPHHDELRLNGSLRPFPFVNIAASSRGTIVRIDANSGDILGEYATAPDGMGRNPSRTTVDQFGNVWVANRDEASDSDGQSKGSVARVGLVLGGARVDVDGSPDPQGGYLAPPFAYNTCQDRDADGLIHSSMGLGDILPWTNDGGADTEGGVSTAADECITNYVRVTGNYTRTIAIDANNDVWVGGLGDTDHEKLDGDTGQPIPGTQVNFGCGGYGGLVDRAGVLWSAQAPLRMDTATLQGQCLGLGVYGIGLDPVTGHIWGTSGSLVREIDPDGTVLNDYPNGSPVGFAQGLAVDDEGNVWVAHSLAGATTVGHVRTDGTFVGNVPLLGGNGPTGVAVDANGKVWSANLGSNSASRIDPEIGPVGGGGLPTGYVDLTVDLGAGAAPYNYSDMTGFVSIAGTSPQGFWRVVQDAGEPGADWLAISWNEEPQGDEPVGTTIDVEARAADQVSELASEPFVAVTNGDDPALLGRYIEVRATLRTDDPATSPVLSDLRIRAAETGGGNHPPVANDDVLVTPQATPGDVDVLANDTDPDPGDLLEVTDATDGAHGTVSCTPAGICTYSPEASFAGTDAFTYSVSDGHGGADEGSVDVTVEAAPPPNRPPIAADDSIETSEDAAGSVNVLANDTDPDQGDTLEVSAWSSAAHGTVSCIGAGLCTYTPDADFSGTDSFTYTVSDPDGHTDEGSVSVRVTPMNDPPTAVDDDLTTDEDVVGSVDVLANDTDPDNDPLSVTAFVQGTHGSVSCASAGLCTYLPNHDFSGTDSFAYTISDGNGGASTATVNVTVEPLNDPPTLEVTGSPADLQYSDPVTIEISANDPDGDAVSFSASGLPGGVALTDHGDGTATISGDITEAAGSYQATVSVSDDDALASELVSFNVRKEDATVSYVGDLIVAAMGTTASVRLAAQVTQQADGHPGDLTKAAVTFELYASGNAQMTTPDLVVGPMAPDASGLAQTTLQLGVDVWTVVARIPDANDYFTSPPTRSPLTVYVPAPGKVIGGGWIPNGTDRSTFGLVVQNKAKRTDVSGNVNYVFRQGGKVYQMRSSGWGGGSLTVSPDGRSATIQGRGAVTIVGSERSSRTITVDFRIDLVDGRGTGPDAFAITIWQGTSLFHQLGTAGAPVTLGGGQVTILLK
jgi:PKD repeat protein